MFYTSCCQVGRSLYLRGYDLFGKRVSKKIPYKPKVYLPSKTKTNFQTVDGKYLEEIEPGNIYQTKSFINTYSGIDGFDVYGYENNVNCFLHETFKDEIQYKEEYIRIAYIDIEVESEYGFPDIKLASEAVNAITIKQGRDLITLGLGDFDPSKYGGKYKKCANEIELLNAFITILNLLDPDIISGYNINGFDIPYLINRIRRLIGEDAVRRLSPYKKYREVIKKRFNKEVQTYVIYGRPILDFMELYRKFGTQNDVESYKLDFIANLELKEKKIDYSEYGSLHLLYKNNYQKFLDYNIHDTLLVEKLENKKKLISLVISIAYMCRVNFEDCFNPTKKWDSIIYGHLRNKGIIIPRKKVTEKLEAYKGAFVKEARPGMHNWIISYDLNSLYPHVIIQKNLGPDTIIKDHIENINVDMVLQRKYKNTTNYSVAANGACFSKDKVSFLSELMQSLYNKRKEYKKLESEYENKYVKENKQEYKDLKDRYANYQWAVKIMLNSLYGAIGNPYFRWYNLQQAEAITVTSQLAIRWISQELNLFLNQKFNLKNEDFILANDTDSAYLTLDFMVKKLCKNMDRYETTKFIDEVSTKIIEPFIKSKYEELKDILGSYKNAMNMEREVIADKGIWTTKKRYMLNVMSKGKFFYKYPELKVVGIEAVKSSTPEICRNKIKTCIKLIMKGDEKKLQKYVALFKKKFYTMNVEDIAFPRSVKVIDKYMVGKTGYTKGTPIHTRASIMYNNLLEEHKVKHLYEKITEGDKIKFVYLKTPNPLGEDVIAIKDVLPKQFNIHKYIDYDVQFEKAFLEPLNIILNVIGWTHKRQNNIKHLLIKVV